jgi:hypothetical protein
VNPIPRRATLKLWRVGLPGDAEAVGRGVLLAGGGGDGAVGVWEKVLMWKGRDGL